MSPLVARLVRGHMEPFLRGMWDRCAGNSATKAMAHVNGSIEVIAKQCEEAEGDLQACRLRLRLAHTNGAKPAELQRGIDEVSTLRHRVRSKANVLRNLEQQRGQLEDVDTNHRVMASLRGTNTALKDVYHGVDEDTALDLADEFDDFAETHKLISGALGPSQEVVFEEDEEVVVNADALAAAMGSGSYSRLVLPTAPHRVEVVGASSESGRVARATNAVRSEIHALRL